MRSRYIVRIKLPRKRLFITFLAVGIFAAATAAGYFGFWHQARNDAQIAVSAPSPEIITPPAEETPLASPLVSPAPSLRAETLQGRIIDVYAERKIVTLQLADGTEKIVELVAGDLPQGISRGNEFKFSGALDEKNGIFAADAVVPLGTETLQFQSELDYVVSRQNFADTLFTKAVIMEFGKARANPKPFYLVIMDPAGRILTPFKNTIPHSSYEIEGNVASASEALEANQRISIGNMTAGIWTIKLVILPGADMTTIFGFEPGLAPKPISELAGRLLYFSIAEN